MKDDNMISRSSPARALRIVAFGAAAAVLASVAVSQHRLEKALAERRDEPAAAEMAQPSPAAQATTALSAAAFKKQLAEMLDERLRAAKGVVAPGDVPKADAAKKREAEEEPPVVTPERQAKIAEAKGMVEGALASGRWSEADRDRIAKLAPTLGDDETFELTMRLIRASNEGKLRKEFPGPPI